MVMDKIRAKLTPAKGEMPALVGRNDPCHCGSGKKYKKCHLSQDEEAERKLLAKAAIPPTPVMEGKKDDKPVAKKPQSAGNPGPNPKTGRGFVHSFFSRKSGGGGA